LDHKLKTEKIE